MKTKKNKYTWKSLGFYRDRCNNLVELKVCEKKKEPIKKDNVWMSVAIISILANIVSLIALINNL